MSNKKRKSLRVAVLVSTDPSDIYFANVLAGALNVVGIVVESRAAVSVGLAKRIGKLAGYILRPLELKRRVNQRLIMKRHAEKVERIVEEGFGQKGREIITDKRIGKIEVTDISSPETVDFLKEVRPDVIAVCGTSILRGPVLNLAPHGVLNLHGGLSQYYRGLWTTLWAVYNEEPWYVGCTVHYVSSGIDDGDIIYQGRPEIEEHDNHETLYVKVVKLGTRLMIRAIEDIESGTARSFPLEKKGRLYTQKMVTPEIIDSTWKKVESGVIREYVRKGAPSGDVALITEPGGRAVGL